MREKFDLNLIKSLVQKHLPDLTVTSVEPTEVGISTNVYRIKTDEKTFYFRIACYDNESYDPEVLVHNLLLEKGVKVPKVIHYENYNRDLGRSFMVISEIKGSPVTENLDPQKLKGALVGAGKDLAVVNSVPVENFGWIKRTKDRIETLEGEYNTYRDFALHKLDTNLKFLVSKGLVDKLDAKAVRTIIDKFGKYLDYKTATLAHGDFDAEHVYENGGSYSGIIDFGDIRGTDPFYDLGTFKVFSPEMLNHLLEGYTQVTPLPDDFELRLSMTSLFFAIQRLTWIGKHLPRNLKNHPTISSVKSDVFKLSVA